MESEYLDRKWEGVGEGAEETRSPPKRTVGDMSRSDYRSVFTFLSKILAVAVGSTTADFEISAPPFLSLALYEDCLDKGAARTVLRPLPVIVGDYHFVRCASMFFCSVSSFIPLQAQSLSPSRGPIDVHDSESVRAGDTSHVGYP